MQEKLDVYKELRSVDLLIDGKIKKESEDFMEDKFIDPITKVTMKQYQAVSASKPFGVHSSYWILHSALFLIDVLLLYRQHDMRKFHDPSSCWKIDGDGQIELDPCVAFQPRLL